MFRTENYTIQNRILSRYEPVGNDRVYMLADHLGTIAAETDNRGTRIYRGWFTPYGAGATSIGEPGRFGWIGSYGSAAWTNGNHPATNYLTSYVRARHYSRTQARWTTVDPLYPGESAYGYVRGWSVKYIDPTGNNPACIGCGICIGGTALGLLLSCADEPRCGLGKHFEWGGTGKQIPMASRFLQPFTSGQPFEYRVHLRSLVVPK